ncbi:hypothetical protein ABFW00_18395, partial [Mycobacteroides abscessus]
PRPVGGCQWQARGVGAPQGPRRARGRAARTATGGSGRGWRDVPLPWEHSIDVVEEAPSEVRADGAGASGCTITMGDMLVSFKNEPNPVCEFAYWG